MIKKIVMILLGSISLHAQELKIGVISDLNSTECQTKYPSNSLTSYKNLLLNQSLDLVLMPGDVVHGECLSYKGSTPYKTVVSQMWQEFKKQFVLPSLAQISFYPIVSPGNHDAPFVTEKSRLTFKIENEGYKAFWQDQEGELSVRRIMTVQNGDNYPFFWAFEKNNLVFIILNSTTTDKLSDGKNQKAWLRELLSLPQVRSAQSRVVMGHIPAYAVLDPSVGSKYDAIMKSEQVGKVDSLMDLLLDHSIDLMLVGHSHAPYPAILKRLSDQKEMKILSMPCGHAPRKLYSKSSLAPRGFAILNFNQQNEWQISVKNWSDGKALNYDYFPKKIPIHDGKVSYSLVAIEDYF